MADFSTDTTFLNDLFGGGQTYDIPGIDWAGLFSSFPDFMSDPGLGGLTGGQQLYFDTQTGQLVTLAQAQQLDPTFMPSSSAPGAGGLSGTGSTSDVLSSGGSQTTGPYGYGGTSNTSDAINQAQMSTLEQILRLAPGTLTALTGLGLLGGAGAALFGQGNQPGTTTQTQTTMPSALNNPAVQQLLGSPGTVTGGTGGAGGTAGPGGSYTGGSGLQGAAGQAAANLQGPQGLLQQQIGSIPQLSPAIQAAIGQNALGFSQGNVPTLNNPQAQAYFQNMLGGQNAAVDYQTGNSLQDAMQQLRARGFAGGSEIFREGAPAAAMGPVVAQANAQKAQNLGNINAQQLQYATALPMLGSQLNTQQLGQQAVPFGAYTTAAQTQSQIPQALLQALMGQGGSTSTSTSTGASPNLLQTLGQIMPLLGGAGGALSSPSVAGTSTAPGLFAQYAGLFG